MTHEQLCAAIPHAGSMCLLERVAACDAQSIVCYGVSHRAESNPLRADNMLSAVNAIEYAAQAMAVHGVFASREHGASARPGLLAAVREVELFVDRIDTLEGELRIEARRLLDSNDALVYQFEVSADAGPVAIGRATVVFMREEAP